MPPTTDQFIGTITTPNAEQQRLHEAKSSQPDWKRWGPYLSERQWGTVREDYSPHGNAWEYLPHDHSRSRAYRWGEDGIAGISDDQQRLCLSLALWNGKDPILKERLFGLTNSEGNHGEDVKELYYYLDATPTHSYLKLLYKYPQREFPYAWLVEENRRRGKDQPEFELLDTGIFDDDRYFDVFVEYAKAAPDDILMLVTVRNRGPETATIHLLPQLWFCDAWSWKNGAAKPRMYLGGAGDSPAPFGDSPNGTRENRSMSRRHTGLRAFPANPPGESPGGTGQWPVPPSVTAEHPELGSYEFYCESRPELLFCNNETNVRRLYGETDAPGYCKDAFHEYVIAGNEAAVNPQQTGTKAAALYKLTIPSGGSQHVRLRLARVGQASRLPFAGASPAKGSKMRSNENAALHGAGETPALHCFADFDAILPQRRREADEFYAELQEDIADPDARLVQRQAFAGMIWSKQFFYYDVPEWIRGDATQPPPPGERKWGRNRE